MNAGYPEEAGAVLLVEVDGLREEVEEEAEEIANVCRTYEPMEILTATSSEEREKIVGRSKRRHRGAWMARAQLLPCGRHGASHQAHGGAGRGGEGRRRVGTCPSPICSTPETETCTHSFSSTSASRVTPTGPLRRAAGY